MEDVVVGCRGTAGGLAGDGCADPMARRHCSPCPGTYSLKGAHELLYLTLFKVLTHAGLIEFLLDIPKAFTIAQITYNLSHKCDHGAALVLMVI